MEKQILVDEPPNNPPIEELPLEDVDNILVATGIKTEEIIGLDAGVLPDGSLISLYLSTGKILYRPESLKEVIYFLEENIQNKNASFVTYYPYVLESIVKMLGEEKCKDLTDFGRLNEYIFRIWYIPTVKITITFNKKTIRIFALGNWFDKREDRKILNELQIEKEGAEAYKELAEKINKATRELYPYQNGDFSTPTVLTKQFLYQDYKRVKVGANTIPQDVYSIAYNCIHAPWIEMYQQGTFEKLYDYDINAAYPSEIANLYHIDNSCGEWIQTTQHNFNATYGFYIAQIKLKKYTPSPILIRYKEKLLAPHGEWIGYITKQEVEFIKRRKIGEVEVIGGWEFFVKRKIKPFGRTVAAIAKLRAKAIELEQESEDEDIKRISALTNYLLKKASARVVGKFLQRIEKIVEDTEEEKQTFWEISPTFNPIYACIVMTNIKIRIAELLLKSKNEVVTITVDGFTTTLPINKKESTYSIGQLKWNEYKDITIAGSLMSNLPHHHIPIVERIKNKPRDRVYGIEMNPRRLQICEAFGLGDFSRAVEETATPDLMVSIGKDRKRLWLDPPVRGGDLLEEVFKSEQWGTQELLFEYQLEESLRRRKNVIN